MAAVCKYQMMNYFDVHMTYSVSVYARCTTALLLLHRIRCIYTFRTCIEIVFSVRQVKQICILPRFGRDIAIPTPVATETIIKTQCADVSLEILSMFYKKHFT